MGFVITKQQRVVEGVGPKGQKSWGHRKVYFATRPEFSQQWWDANRVNARVYDTMKEASGDLLDLPGAAIEDAQAAQPTKRAAPKKTTPTPAPAPKADEEDDDE